MANYVPLKFSAHGGAGFRRAQNLQHAQNDRHAPVLIDELAQVLPYMPLCFIKQRAQESTERFQLVALQGLDEQKNLFLQPGTHKWISGYTPACYRGYPFALGQDTASGESVLCFDLDSALMRENPSDDDVLFFDAAGEPSQAVKDTLEFLKAAERSRQQTQAAVDRLSAAGLIKQWPLELKAQDNRIVINGLYKVDEASLQALQNDSLQTLHQANALQVAYAQLLSLPQVKHLARLKRYHDRYESVDQKIDIEKLFDSKNDIFSFDLDS